MGGPEMGMIAKTLTKGFRTCYFRNQPVHQFYGHLQAVLKDIDPSGEMSHLFARPEQTSASDQEIEWSSELSGKPLSFRKLSPADQEATASLLADYIEKIRQYAEAKQNKSGIEKDYADYLKAVAMSPDLDQVFVINKKPVLVHWGFFCDSEKHPGQGIYAGWDEFIAQIKRKAPPEEPPAKQETTSSKSEPQPAKAQKQAEDSNKEQAEAAAAVFAQAPAKQEPKQEAEQKAAAKTDKEPEKASKEPEAKPVPAKKPDRKPPVKSKQVIADGFGDYTWVKWLAIILAIIMLLLLLLRFMAPQRSGLGGMGGIPGGMGGMPAAGGGMPGGGGGMPGGGGGQTPPHTCPHCGHNIETGQQQPANQQDTPQKPAAEETEAEKPQDQETL
jgi:chemotaxis protein histidine kinase CheA